MWNDINSNAISVKLNKILLYQSSDLILTPSQGGWVYLVTLNLHLLWRSNLDPSASFRPLFLCPHIWLWVIVLKCFESFWKDFPFAYYIAVIKTNYEGRKAWSSSEILIVISHDSIDPIIESPEAEKRNMSDAYEKLIFGSIIQYLS